SSLLNSLGYHSVFVYGTTSVVNYAVIANPVGNGANGSLTNFQTITNAITQQLADAVTDPESNAWIDRATGYEIATQVASPGNSAVLYNYVVAGLWSVVQGAAAYPVGSTPPVYNPSADQIIAANILTPVANYFTHTLEYFDGLVETYYKDF